MAAFRQLPFLEVVMTGTKLKVNEAKFFLEKMKESFQKQPDFDYYLSAFISSSRSVLWVMRCEFSKIHGWEEWIILWVKSSNREVSFTLY
jgi:hypothetical protein